MAELTPEMFQQVLPLACVWAKDYETLILQRGQGLTPSQLNDARLAGVDSPERIRLLKVAHIPPPDDERLKYANDIVQLVTPATAGLTLNYGIFIRADCWTDRKLLVHEFVHTSQYERLGGIKEFLSNYLQECITYGYPQAPMEQEAITQSKRICSQPIAPADADKRRR